MATREEADSEVRTFGNSLKELADQLIALADDQSTDLTTEAGMEQVIVIMHSISEASSANVAYMAHILLSMRVQRRRNARLN
jgi:hypothetical protein